jgi:hypothetical protein
MLGAVAQKWNGWVIQPEKEVVLPSHFQELKGTGANMVVLTPYALTSNLIPRVEWNTDWQWVGEKDTGVIAAVMNAKAEGFQCAIKPQLSMEGPGSVSELEMLGPNDWKVWWGDYTAFILHYAHIADSLDVLCFVIGDELTSSFIPLRNEWSLLIDSIRGFYDGQLTYAASSDAYTAVPFWSELDLIGINAHYRCDSSETPDSRVLEACFTEERDQLADYSKRLNRPVLFTDFGFRSVDHTAWESDAMPSIQHELFLHTNPLGQVHAFRSFFKVFWTQEWVKGGWIFKWEPRLPVFATTGNGYTPQGKAALDVIKAWFEEF